MVVAREKTPSMSGTNDQPRPGRCGPLPNGQATVDTSRVAALYSEYGTELRRFVLGVVRDAPLADDVVQATFARVIERGHTARPETFKGWLFQVAFREALTARRRRETRDQANRRLASLVPGRPAGEGPEEALIREETVAAVRKALGALPDDQGRVVWARLYEDKTFAEIAEEFGLPLGTVLTRMRLALEKLKRSLRPGD
jgi:RNA polymerase sigma factor (sigma-70 family)